MDIMDKTNPSYYKAQKGFEVIDVIEEFTKGLDGVEAFDTSNIIKYICRWHEKDGIHDLKKAKWYLEHLIAHAREKETERVKEAFERHNESHSYEVLYSVRFETYKDAFQVLLNITTIINTYGQLTVPDLQDLVWPTRIDFPYGYRNFGWKDTKGWDIKKMKDFWILIAPKPVELVREDGAKRLRIRFDSYKDASKFEFLSYRYFVDHDELTVEDFLSMLENMDGKYIMDTYTLDIMSATNGPKPPYGWTASDLVISLVQVREPSTNQIASDFIFTMPHQLVKRSETKKLKYLKLSYPSVKAASKVRDALCRYLTENDFLRVEDFAWIMYNVAASPVFPLKDKIANATAQFLGDKENAKLGWTNETFQITMNKVDGSEVSAVLYLSPPRKLEEDE